MKKHLNWLKKIIVCLGILAILVAIFTIFLPPKTESNKENLEKQIGQIFFQQQNLIQELSQLMEGKEFEKARENIPLLKENNLRLLELNQKLGQIDKNYNLASKEEVLNNNLEFFEKIEDCLSFYPQEQEAFAQCQKNINKQN